MTPICCKCRRKELERVSKMLREDREASPRAREIIERIVADALAQLGPRRR
jgi:hypothetical protein